MSDFQKGKVKLHLTGKNGNAFAILGAARTAGEMAGWSLAEKNLFLEEATAGDYANLLATCFKWFDVS